MGEDEVDFTRRFFFLQLLTQLVKKHFSDSDIIISQSINSLIKLQGCGGGVRNTNMKDNKNSENLSFLMRCYIQMIELPIVTFCLTVLD